MESKKIFFFLTTNILIFLSFCAFAAPLSFAAGDPIGCCLKTNQNTGEKTSASLTQKKCDAIYEETGHGIKGDFQLDKTAIANKCEPKPVIEPRDLGAPIYFTPSVSIPDSKYVAGTPVKVEESTSALANYIVAIMKYATGIIGIIAVISVMVGGILWLTAAGNHEQISTAKKTIGGSLAGMCIAFGAFMILSTVNTNLTNFKITGVTPVKHVGLDTVCALKQSQDGKFTAEEMTFDNCNKIQAEQVNDKGYKSVDCTRLISDGWVAAGEECKATRGCCSIDIGTQIALFRWPWGGSEFCVEKMNETDCKSNATSALWSFFPVINFIKDDVKAKYNNGLSCQAVPACSGKLVCSTPTECKAKLKPKDTQ